MFFKICLSFGLGAGVFSCVYFILSLFNAGPGRNVVLAVEFAVTLLLALFVFYPKPKKPADEFIRSGAAGSIPKIISALFYSFLVLNITAFACVYISNPHGGWDAWAIWNMRARFLFRNTGVITDIFSPALWWSHVDYPLLIPGLVARNWSYFGRETTLAPFLISFFFTFSCLGVLFLSLEILRGRKYAMASGLVLLLSPYYFYSGTTQYADVPLSFFILSSFAVMLFHDMPGYKDNRLLALSGLLASLAAWTKNEGLLFLLALGSARLVLTCLRNGYRKGLGEIILFSAGAFPVLAVIILFKNIVSMPNYFISSLDPGVFISKAFDFSRHALILKFLASELFNVKHWNLFPLLFIAGALSGKFNIRPENKPGVLAACLVFLFSGAGYYLVFLLSPFNLEWHLSSSIARLFAQFWPLVVFLAVLSAGRFHPPAYSKNPD
ncbi:MAG: hypothetical protein A2297_07025 [Elusimicrobia bacterium RIFOXYB2_FULL_48_7]|nr:MAG: hypothetical protein A2297_07025 [Elusimicrobia bacterium RIFOXYB2_FULL_48_7]